MRKKRVTIMEKNLKRIYHLWQVSIQEKRRS